MKGNIDNFKQIIAKELGLGEREVGNTLALLNDGCTIPFISRYRKERTGSMDEMQIAAIYLPSIQTQTTHKGASGTREWPRATCPNNHDAT